MLLIVILIDIILIKLLMWRGENKRMKWGGFCANIESKSGIESYFFPLD